MTSERKQRIEAVGYDYVGAPKRRVQACNLCGCARFTILAHRDRYGFNATAAACERCGLVFQDPMMTEEACGDFYARVYRPLVSAFHGRPIDAESIEADQARYADALAELLDPFIRAREPRRLLDMGGSTGVIAQHLVERFGLEATVCDPSPEETTRARDRGLETVVGTAEGYDPGDNHFDIVLLCQTVDHLLDIAGSLANLRRLLAGSGLFFIDIVDFRAAYLRAWNVEAALKIDHPYYLTESTAEAFLARIGFEVMRKDYAPDRLHVGYVCAAAEPLPEPLPNPGTVASLLKEIRYVQNAPRPE